MIHPPVHHFIQSLADGLTCFDIYYTANRDEWQDFIFRRNYNKFGIGGEEQYDNERDFAEYPGETLFYHLLMVEDAINPQTKLYWFIQDCKEKGQVTL